MSDDFGLGFNVDTKPLKGIEKALKGVAGAADKTDKSIDDLDKTTKKSAKVFSETTVTVDEFAEALDIDSSKFDASHKSILSSLNNSIKRFDTASLSVDRFEQDQKQAGNTITSTGRVVDKQGVEVVKLTRRWQDLQVRLKGAKGGFDAAQKSALALTSATQKTSSSFKLQKNASQQLGFQLQDMAVMAQMGISPFTILGQQGSQLAGVFGTGGALLGAVIAIGAALGGILWKVLGNVSESAEELRGRIDELTGSIKDLSKANRDFISQDEASKIKKREKEIKSLSKSIAKYEVKLKDVAGAQERFDAITGNSTSSQRRQDRIKLEIKASKKYTEELVKLRAQLDLAQGSIRDSKGIIDDVSITAIDVWKNSMLQAIAITGQAEATRWNAIKEGQRLRQEEVKSLQLINDLSKSIALSDMNSRDAAIEKGKAQVSALNRKNNGIIESEITALQESSKSLLLLETERYKKSLLLLEDYAKSKGMLDAQIRNAELLLAKEHQDNLLIIEQQSAQKRIAATQSVVANIDLAVGAISNINTIASEKERAQLQKDLATQGKFSAAEIALKEKTARALFQKQKNADLAMIISSTAVAIAANLGNPAAMIAAGLNGGAQLVVAQGNQYGGGGTSPATGGFATAPPSVANTTNNNSGGNITNINISGVPDAGALEQIKQALRDGDILFDNNSTQAQVLTS